MRRIAFVLRPHVRRVARREKHFSEVRRSNIAFKRMSAALSVLMAHNFSKTSLRARRALEFSHSQDPNRPREMSAGRSLSGVKGT